MPPHSKGSHQGYISPHRVTSVTILIDTLCRGVTS